ncbi:ABC transporter substrate-binding protein [Geochorda subterranea]|uniref:Sugar ABC transporter substrate-binding protein n=1 Tax=Geochorda subterranea TaxID=3109564 RepID=A0ABZ1BMG2_9FIRM|nr:sugar ABC transporter substrate-binding protein [Limnochorda sp. LNt]WRP13651.1 sugar ABC transporter substrate-binding protein [Limnochorda sp. LNt]
MNPSRYQATVLTVCLVSLALVGSLATLAAAAPVTLRFQSWRLADPVSGPLYMKWIAEYQQLHPNVRIEPEPVPHAQRLEKFIAQVLAGDPPDVVGLTTGDVVQFAALGQVENLDRFYQAEGPEFIRSFTPVTLALSEHEGSYYALSHEVVTTDGMWYNVDLLAKAGLDPEEALSTWDAFVAASKKLTGAGTYAMALRGKDTTGSMANLWSFLSQLSGPLVTEDDIRKNLDSPGALKVFKEYVELYTVHKVTPNPLDIDFTAMSTLFAQGRTAFMHNGSWMKPIIEQQNPAMKGRFLPYSIPTFAGGNRIALADGMAFMIGKGSRHASEAWEFMKFMVSRKKQMENLEVAGFLPSLTELAGADRILNDPYLAVFARELAERGVPRPRTAKLNEIWTEVQQAFQAVLLGQKTPEEALRSAANRIRSDILRP